jgi:hypothetical protein
MKVTIVVLKLLFIGALFLVSNNELRLVESQDLNTFIDLYVAWLGNLFSQSVELTGYVANSQWLPTSVNETIFS